MEGVEAAESVIIMVHGIGPANYALKRCLKMGEAFQISDIVLLKGIKLIKILKTKSRKAAMTLFKEQWRSWCSYATFYNWHLLY